MLVKLISISAVAFVISPVAYAKDLPTNARLITDEEMVRIYPNKTFKGTMYDKKGKKTGTYTLQYASGGKKNVKVKFSGKKTRSFAVGWRIKGGKLCQDQIASGKHECGNGGIVYKVGNRCLVSRDRKTVSSEFRCK